MPRGRGHALAIGVLLFWCAIGLADGRRTCLSTRRTARLGCSSKCRADRAERHCQACICAACAFCNSISSTAVQRTSRAAGTGTRSGGDDDSTRQPGQGSSNTGSSEVVAARSRSTSGGNVYRAGSRLVRAFSVATARGQSGVNAHLEAGTLFPRGGTIYRLVHPRLGDAFKRFVLEVRNFKR